MKVTVFSINKYKSSFIKHGYSVQFINDLPDWTINANNCEVVNGKVRGVNRTQYMTMDYWNSTVDEKYVRRRYHDLH